MTFDRRAALILIVFAFVVVVGLLGWSFYFQRATSYVAGTNPLLSQPEAKVATPVLVPLRISDPSRGSDSPNAIVIVLFGDYLSAESRALENELKSVLAEQRTPTRLVWRDFYPAADHPGYMTAALAARCAGDQGKFWDMHDALLTELQLNMDVFRRIAGKILPDTGKFKTCLESGKYLKAIGNDVTLEGNNNIAHSPTLFIDQKPFVGYLTADKISSLVWSAAHK